MTEGVINRIAENRKALGLTQQTLAEALGVSRQTVNAIERGKFLPSLPLALQLATYFGTRVEALFELQSTK